MSLATTPVYCTIRPPLSGAMEDCSIVWVQQLQMLYCRRWCKSALQRMFGSLWNTVVAHEHWRQDGSCQLGMMAKLHKIYPTLSINIKHSKAQAKHIAFACCRHHNVPPLPGYRGWLFTKF